VDGKLLPRVQPVGPSPFSYVLRPKRSRGEDEAETRHLRSPRKRFWPISMKSCLPSGPAGLRKHRRWGGPTGCTRGRSSPSTRSLMFIWMAILAPAA